MKNTMLALLLLCSTLSRAQDIPLAVYPVRQANNLSAEQMATLRSKIITLVSNAGYASTDAGAAVGVQAEITQSEPRTVNTGTRNLTIIDAELVLRVQQRDGAVIFGSKSKKLGASGKDAQQARRQLLAALSATDAAFQTFLQETKPKIADYYQQNCARLLADAQRKSTTDQFKDALSILVNIPGNTACRADADKQMETTYAQYRDQICSHRLMQAQSAAAAKNYAAADAALRQIDPRAGCFPEAQKFVQQLRDQANADRGAELNALVEYWKAEAALDRRHDEIVRSFLKDLF